MRSGPLPQQTPTTMAQALKAAEAAALEQRRRRLAHQPGPKEGPWAGVPGYECRRVSAFFVCMGREEGGGQQQ